jgi:TIR domain
VSVFTMGGDPQPTRAEAMSRPGSQTRIFISYSRKDAAFADRVWDALKERGFLAAIDHDEIFSLEKWWDRLKTLMMQADTVVFVVSPNSIASKVALNEVEFAASMNKRFAPIIWRRVAEDSMVPDKIREYNFIFFDDESQFASSMDRLVEALNTDIDWLRLHTEYGQAARKWSNEKRPRGLLLRSPSLERAEKWVNSRPSLAPPPTAEAYEQSDASTPDDSRLITPETTPPSIPTNSPTAPPLALQLLSAKQGRPPKSPAESRQPLPSLCGPVRPRLPPRVPHWL